MSMKLNELFYYFKNTPRVDKSKEYISQLEKEEKYILERRKLHLNKGEKNINKIIDKEELQKYVKYKYYNAKVMETISEITDVVVSFSEDSYFMREYFTNVKQVGKESVMGYAMTSSFEGIDNLFVIKVPRQQGENLSHEFFVGAKLNQLRAKIPNFSYVYGTFNCSPPYLIDKKIPYMWCLMDNKTNYIIYENIVPSVNFSDYLVNCSIDDFFNVFMQILFSLDMAFEQFGFVHYDLHCNNVLVKKLEKTIDIPYLFEGKTYFIKTNVIGTIIDYGFGRVIDNNEIYSYEGGPTSYGVNFSKPTTINDSYKLLSHSLKILCDNNREDLVRKILPIYNYIVDIELNGKYSFDDIKKIFNDISTTYYLYPNAIKNIKITSKDVINYIAKNYDLTSFILYNKPPSNEILSCEFGNKCDSESIIKENILLADTKDELFKLYIMLKHNPIEANEQIKNNKNKYYMFIVNTLNTISKEISEKLSVKNIQYELKNIDGIQLNEKMLNDISDKYGEIIRALDIITLYIEKLEFIKLIVDKLNIDHIIRDLSNFFKIIEEWNTLIKQMQTNIEHNIKKIVLEIKEFPDINKLQRNQIDFVNKYSYLL